MKTYRKEKCLADGGVIKETPEQMLARMNAKYGLGGTGAPPPQAQAPTPAPTPSTNQRTPTSGGLLGKATETIGRRAEELKKAANYARGGVMPVVGRGTGTSDSVPAVVAGQHVRLSNGEGAAILPAKTMKNPAAVRAIEGIIEATNGRPPVKDRPAGGIAGGLRLAYGGLLDPQNETGISGVRRIGNSFMQTDAGPSSGVAPAATITSPPARPGVSLQPPEQAPTTNIVRSGNSFSAAPTAPSVGAQTQEAAAPAKAVAPAATPVAPQQPAPGKDTYGNSTALTQMYQRALDTVRSYQAGGVIAPDEKKRKMTNYVVPTPAPTAQEIYKDVSLSGIASALKPSTWNSAQVTVPPGTVGGSLSNSGVEERTPGGTIQNVGPAFRQFADVTKPAYDLSPSVNALKTTGSAVANLFADSARAAQEERPYGEVRAERLAAPIENTEARSVGAGAAPKPPLPAAGVPPKSAANANTSPVPSAVATPAGERDAYGNSTAITQQLKAQLAAAQADNDQAYARQSAGIRQSIADGRDYQARVRADADRFTRFSNEADTARVARDLARGGGAARSNAGIAAALQAMQQRDAAAQSGVTARDLAAVQGANQLANAELAGKNQFAIEDLRQSGPEKALLATKLRGELGDAEAHRAVRSELQKAIDKGDEAATVKAWRKGIAAGIVKPETDVADRYKPLVDPMTGELKGAFNTRTGETRSAAPVTSKDEVARAIATGKITKEEAAKRIAAAGGNPKDFGL